MDCVTRKILTSRSIKSRRGKQQLADIGLSSGNHKRIIQRIVTELTQIGKVNRLNDNGKTRVQYDFAERGGGDHIDLGVWEILPLDKYSNISITR